MNEQELIATVIAGDDEAYGQLIERYQAGLVRYCFTVTRDEDAAEDIAQEAFIRVFEKLPSYKPEYKFSTWLYRIARNLALKSLRRQTALPLNDEIELVSDDQAVEAAATEEREAAVRAAVAALPANYREAVHLHYWERRDYAEVAEIMGVPSTTIKTWLYRARQELKEKCSGIIG
jgi:RNA polymerase sigma-70 factor (ECF subfamily)